VQGNILYRFPSLQITAGSRRTGRKEYVGMRLAQSIIGIDKYFNEQKWQFRLQFSTNNYIFMHFALLIFPVEASLINVI
jgi:hypothetical protein